MAGAGSRDDAELVEALRRGDEAAFAGLVEELTPALVRLALAHVPSRAVAEDVVQDTWLGVIRGIDRFEGRSSLRTWIFQILLNIARTRGPRERRTLPFSSLSPPGRGGPRRARRRPRPLPGPPRRATRRLGAAAGRVGARPEERLASDAARDVLLRAIADAAAAPARGAHAARRARATRPRRPVTRSSSARPTSECSCTGRARR